MIQNTDIFDFELTTEDMGLIASLDKGESLFFIAHLSKCRWNLFSYAILLELPTITSTPYNV